MVAGALQERLITQLNPRSVESEAYRTLRTNIQFSTLDRSLRTLLVTSSGPEEGKSTTAANLAIAMAQTGHDIVLCDADLRRPSLHEIFGVPNAVGITSLLLGSQLEDAVQATGIDHLRLISSGPIPPNPAELLGSQRMESLIRELVTVADTVIFDTPPIGAVTDGAVLASRVDGVVLVISSGKTRRDQARKAKQLLEKVKAQIIGVVINNAVLHGRDRYRYASDDE